MQKYNTEQNINFYSELAKSLNNPTEQIGDNICLITNSPLTENFITLECNHKFNYTPLVNDLTNHKYKFNSMERRRLKPTEIRCPYCRNIQTNLLPYYDNMNVNKIHGVNFIDESIQLSTTSRCVINNGTFVGVCAFETTDISGNNYKCNCTFVSTVAVLNATYCNQHKYMALSKYLTAKNLQEKEQKKILAAKAKEDKKILAAKAKEEKVALAAKAKEEKVALAAKAKEEKVALAAKAKEDKKILAAKAKEDMKNANNNNDNGNNYGKLKVTKKIKNSTIEENIII